MRSFHKNISRRNRNLGCSARSRTACKVVPWKKETAFMIITDQKHQTWQCIHRSTGESYKPKKSCSERCKWSNILITFWYHRTIYVFELDVSELNNTKCFLIITFVNIFFYSLIHPKNYSFNSHDLFKTSINAL